MAVVVGEMPRDRRRIVNGAMERLERWGMPIWLPLEVHFITRDQFERMRRGGADFVRAEDYLKRTSGEA